MSNDMRKGIKIIQQNIKLKNQSHERHLIIVEVQDEVVVKSYFTKIPDRFVYYNSIYPYYAINEN